MQLLCRRIIYLLLYSCEVAVDSVSSHCLSNTGFHYGQELEHAVFVGGSPVALYLKAFKVEVILSQRKKTFIVYECGVTQVLSEKNREVRSWFEVSEVILPPLFSFNRQLDFGLVPIKKNQHIRVKAIHCNCQRQSNIPHDN